MASITMTASFLGTTSLTKGSPRIAHRRLVVANTAKGAEVESVKLSGETKRECNNRRRELMFAAAAAAVCSVAGVAAAGEPKPGTPEARKVYAPICVTMPTAKICHK
ncbi:photosystem II 5 kDa protein, chloroplastic-like [Herrania umbratica]|uniref:Photosystem II 5 kDa protein, chloroplastic-like n=1 Tax=Herrania umbratica TaxID=108875 RepID=A0A6J1A0M8_9ROSI|nr:photosystem II 5 kDa protein, chloroplastic-like [Herrania umbratica]